MLELALKSGFSFGCETGKEDGTFKIICKLHKMSDSIWFAGQPCPLLLGLVELEEKPPLLKFHIKNTRKD